MRWKVMIKDRKYYLKPNVQMEPLVNRWYAWSHLIAPATAAMNLANLHIKIMKSFVSAPQVHAAALKKPSMRGGPFLDLEPSRVGEVKEMVERTCKEQAHLIRFAEAVKSLNETIATEGNGPSLEPLYHKVPEALKGYVELVYDLNSNPSIRFLERLLYKSPYYDETLQALELSLIDTDYRPFVFSTPRFDDERRLQINIPFRQSGVDELFKMRHTPASFDFIKQELGFDDRYDEKFLSFLTTEPPARRPSKYYGDGIRIRYLNHACILVETRDISILTDPIISYEYESDVYRYTFSDLPEVIDYVLLTHTHSDHVVLESLLQIRHKIGAVIVPRSGGGALEDPSLKLALENIGFLNVIEIDELEAISIPGGSITGIPFFGEHGDLNIRSKIAHLICLEGKSILCAADSRNVEFKLYERLHQHVGDIDILFLGMECDGAPLSWMYGALCTKPLDRKMDQTRRLNGSDYERGIDIVNQFNCGRAYVYAMGQEPWLSFLTSIKYTDESRPIVESNRLVEDCKSRGIVSERLYGAKEIYLNGDELAALDGMPVVSNRLTTEYTEGHRG
jgi:L-ascorbate metabolism protein UlaG (beta-lactamase superfamily)